MKKKYILMLLTLITLLNPLQAQVLNVVAVEQEQDQWCWSGSSACILDYYCTTTPQCTIAEYTRTVATWHNFGSVNCCTNPNVGCNYWNYNWGYPGSIQDILIHFASIQNSGYGSYLSTSSIQTQIAANRPFVIRWGWTTGGGHFLVGHGLVNQDLYYMDPWFGEGLKIASYSWVVSGSNHTWTHTNIINTSSPRPYPASSITGSQSVCRGQQGIIYSTSTITNATSYLWQLSPPTVGTIVSNGTTATLNLNSTFTGTFTITVRGQNSCGVGSLSAPLSVTVYPLPVPTITGLSSVCAGTTGVNYTTETGMTGYNWTVSAGGTITAGTGTKTITVTWNTAGAQTVSVNYTNSFGCSASATTILYVIVGVIGGDVSGGTTITFGQSTGPLILNGQTGYVSTWQRQYNTSGYVDIPSTSGVLIYSEIPAYTGSWQYRAVIQNGSCPTENSDPTNVIVQMPAGTQKIWIGTISDDWNNPGNWSPGGIPVSSDKIVIPSSVPYMPIVKNSGSICNDAIVYNNSTLTINPSDTLIVNGSLILGVDCGAPFTDSRDGKTYSTVLIGSQCWMAQNLNIGTRIDGSAEQLNNSIIEKYCYDDNESNCEVYGGLYQLGEAMQYEITPGVQGICPTGWHLPTDEEWTTLSTFLEGENVAGGKMKEEGYAHWLEPNAGATNSSGFTALPGGFRDYYSGYFGYVTYNAYFWSSSQVGASNAWYRFLTYGYEYVGQTDLYYKTDGFSARCVRD